MVLMRSKEFNTDKKAAKSRKKPGKDLHGPWSSHKPAFGPRVPFRFSQSWYVLTS
jgi:hypothetical protein